MTSTRLLLGLLFALLGAMPATAQEAEAEADSVQLDESGLSDLERARLRLGDLDEIRASIETLISESQGLGGEELQLKRVEALTLAGELEEASEQLAGLIGKVDEAVADSMRTAAEPALRYSPTLYLRALEFQTGKLSQERSGRERIAAEDLPALESEIAARQERIDSLVDDMAASVRRMERIGLDADDLWDDLDNFMSRRAESLAGRLQLAIEERNRIEDRARTATDSDADPELAIINRRIDALVSSLKFTTDLMSSRGLETAGYDQLIIETTGSLTEDILDPEVLKGLIGTLWDGILDWFRKSGPTLAVWILLLLISVGLTRLGFIIIWQALRLLLRPSRLLQNLINGLLRPTSTIVGLLIGLWVLGVSPTTLLAGVGVLSVIVGLALQDSLGNIAAGVFILIYRPYDVDEIVHAGGVLGRVRQMGLANTLIVTFDRRRLFVPNKKIWSEVIENRSAEPLRRTEAVVRIRYDADINATIEYLQEIMADHELVLSDPPTEVFVSQLEDSWVEISVWPWTYVEHWWTMQTNLQRILRLALNEKGIVHAFPRYEVEGVGKPPPSAPPASEA